MLNSRQFLHYLNLGLGLTLIDMFSLSCKYSSGSKQHFIKTLNFENRVLYGSLLETRKQRRKSIAQESDKKSVNEDNTDKTPKNTENGIPEGCRKRGRPRKATTNSPSNSQQISSTDPYQIVSSQKNEESNVFSSIDSDKSENKLKSRLKDTTLKTSEFMFKPLVLINDENYPLENPAKITSYNTLSEEVLNHKLSDSVMKYSVKFPSVSAILEGTMSDKSRIILSKWQQKMISNLGQEGFNQYFRDLKTRGDDFHLAVCNRVLGKPTEKCSEVTQKGLKSLEWMMEHVSNPLAVESATAHPLLEYRGIPDCILHFRGTPVVVDWKLSDKPKKILKETYEAPVQITAYIGAVNHDPNYKLAVNHGLVVVAYTSGDPCDVFLLAPKHCQIYWRHWLGRCEKYKARNHLHTDHVIDEAHL